MKFNISAIAALMLGTIVAFTSCDDELDLSAPLSRFEVDGVSATAGDESVLLKWKPQSGKPTPATYYISWTSSSADSGTGSAEVDGSSTEYLVKNLVNDVAYTFAVQARYEDGLAQKITASATPKTTRLPVEEYKATAGNECVFLSWVEPATALDYTYEIVASTGGNTVQTLTAAKGTKSLLVSDLQNDTEYAFEITSIYAHGRSVSQIAKATPGHITPISCMPETPHVFELVKLEYNPAYFIEGVIASVQWSIDGLVVSTDESLSTGFSHPGKNVVAVEITYAGGKKASGSIDVDVQNFAWSELPNAGYQKATNFAFSPDGQTLYTIGQSNKTIYAVNAVTGQVKWQETLGAATYGAGVAVGSDGKVYFGTEDKAGTLYCYTPNGTVRWTAEMGGAVKAAPAVTSDGTVYALCDGASLIAYDGDNGRQLWKASLSGSAGGVAVDADGIVYAGTSAGVWAYSATGTRLWASEALKVTERGGSLALAPQQGIVYATLKGKGGVAALDMATGATRWTYASAYNDCYHPVTDGQGNVYFNEKNGALYCVSPAGTLKWEHTAHLGYTYSGFALGENGHAYITQYNSPFAILDIDSNGTATELSNTTQTMSPVCLGPDCRLYFGRNGSVATYNLGVRPMTEGWHCRGGNLQGTNSLK